jgi:hypothetical protein
MGTPASPSSGGPASTGPGVGSTNSKEPK